MSKIVVLHQDWRNKQGVLKSAGTEITFHPESRELKELLRNEIGSLKMGLPIDLPGRKFLEKAGYDSVQSLAEIQDWTLIKGIGEKTANELNNYLKPREE